MKGLITKDLYIIFKSSKIFLILMLIFALIPTITTNTFAIFYATLIPITSIAYDERSKWNQLAAMLPYKKRDIVFSKYFMGIAASAIVVVLAIVSNYTCGIIGTKLEDLSASGKITIIIFTWIVSVILFSFNIPIIFKLGAEKGRMVYLFVTVGFATAFAFIITDLEIDLSTISILSLSTPLLLIGLGVVATVIFAISMAISNKIYDYQVG